MTLNIQTKKMTRAYFLSDLHLGASDSPSEFEKQEKVLRFLRSIKNDVSHIFFVGDFFDFWFEYKYVMPKKYFNVLAELKQLADAGIEMHYLAGNHDFYLGSFFDDVLHISTHSDEYTFKLDGKAFYLWHGDGLATQDVGYRFLKKVMRNRWNLKLFRLLHPDFGIPFARYLSGSSRQYTNQLNHLRDESDYTNFADEKFADGYDFVIMGHRHNPLVHSNGEKRYINLGDWIDKFTYALFDGKELQLLTFEDYF